MPSKSLLHTQSVEGCDVLPHVVPRAGVRLPEQRVDVMPQAEAGHVFRVHDDGEKVLIASKIHLKWRAMNNILLSKLKIIMMTKSDTQYFVSNFSEFFTYLIWLTLHNALGEMCCCCFHYELRKWCTGCLCNLLKVCLVVSHGAETWTQSQHS